jgi:hypothetical protein
MGSSEITKFSSLAPLHQIGQSSGQNRRHAGARLCVWIDTRDLKRLTQPINVSSRDFREIKQLINWLNFQSELGK